MKLKFNYREKDVQEEALRDGWKVLFKGWPDFLCYKESSGKKIEAFFLEVKRKPYKRHAYGKSLQTKTFDVKLSPEQLEMHKVLKKLGFKVKVVYKD